MGLWKPLLKIWNRALRTLGPKPLSQNLKSSSCKFDQKFRFKRSNRTKNSLQERFFTFFSSNFVIFFVFSTMTVKMPRQLKILDVGRMSDKFFAGLEWVIAITYCVFWAKKHEKSSKTCEFGLKKRFEIKFWRQKKKRHYRDDAKEDA